MRKFTLAMLAFTFLLLSHAKAQTWYEKKAATATLKEIQDSFYSTYKKEPADEDEKGRENEAKEGNIQFKRWEAFWQRRMKPTDHFPSPSATYDAWAAYVNSHPATTARTQSQATWTFHGQQSSPGGYYGLGKLNCVGFHPTDSNTLWAGSAYGGLWKTTNGGLTWTTNPGSMENSGINDIVINYANPNIMYLVTSENYGGMTRQTGVMKTIDGGNTWTATTLTYPASSYIYFRKIIMHPTNPDILVVAASNGIWKSTDAGGTWTKTQSGSYIDIKFKPTDPTVVYASNTVYNSGYTANLYKSSNTADSWSVVKTIPGAGWTVLAVSPANPNLVMTVSCDNQGGLFGLCRSINSGISFSLFYQGNSTNNILSYSETGSGTGGQGSYDLVMAINPANANDVWVGGINTWNSVDQGLHWNIKNHWYGANGIPEVHADKHFLAFNPYATNTIFECNDGGIYKSTNSGTSWNDLTNGMGISQIYFLSAGNTVNDKVFCGLQDNGSKLMENQTWSEHIGGDGFGSIIDYVDSNTMYGSIYSGNVYKTTDNGANWNTICTDQGTGVNASSSFYTNFTMNPTDHKTLLIGKAQVYKTINAGVSWTQLGVITNAQLSQNWAITYAPSNTQVIYAANDVNLYKTTNGGLTWKTLTNPQGYISSIALDPLNAQKFWIVYSYAYGGPSIFKSTDGGQTFTNITGTIPTNIAINCITYQKGSNDGLYTGTDIGVFYRDSTMSDWVYYNDGLPNIVVNDLQIAYTTNKLWAGTYGRGLWTSDLYSALPLKLLNFSAKLQERTVVLKWLTTAEINTKAFNVERSENATNWTVIATVNARNAAGDNNYASVDNQPLKGYNYYRLKMIDKDGQFTYSPVRVVNMKQGNETIALIPNPSSDYTNIIFNTTPGKASISLFDEAGRKVFSTTLKDDNTNVYRLSTKSFATGVYVLKIEGTSINVSERLVIQK